MSQHTSFPKDKQCRSCLEFFPRTEEYFFRQVRYRDGLGSYCKNCHRTINRKNIQKLRDNDPEYDKEYYLNNKRRVSERTNARRHRIRANGGFYTDAEIQELYEEQGSMCFYCSEPLGNTYDKDHYIPLSKGGTNYIENIVLACEPCNASKGDKLPSEWKGRFTD